MTTHEPCGGGCGQLADECECANPHPLAGFTFTPIEERRRRQVTIDAPDEAYAVHPLAHYILEADGTWKVTPEGRRHLERFGRGSA